MRNTVGKVCRVASWERVWVATTSLLMLVWACTLDAQKDPGPRAGPAGAGGAYSTLNASQKSFFEQALARFNAVDSVSGTIPGTSGGLGPAYNANSCATCHSQPAIGGSGPGMTSPQKSVPNPEVAMATLDGAANTVPSFITADGPVREVRFRSDGGVHDLYSIAGRSDAVGCNLAQPNFEQQLARGNVVFRIPTPMFGIGLVENTSDAVLAANLAANQSQKRLLGIRGSFNTSGNDGTITRFGWKAQNKSLLMFAGEAYNVEMGVSNELFPNERSAVAGCVFNGTPEDAVNIVNPANGSADGTGSAMSSDVINFSMFARLSEPPAAAAATASSKNGQNLFNQIGCVLCHSDSLQAAASPYAGMGQAVYHPFSDFAVHHMGSGLADGITQGSAGPDQFRTAPLWGVGQRLFFMHDGRTADLLEAIRAHQSSGSEASNVIRLFEALNSSQMQDILNFLRSL